MAAILQIIKSPFLDEQLADFDEIWYMTAYLELNDSHVNKYDFFLKFKMADIRHTENRFFWP